MKKTYQVPFTEMVTMETLTIICTSGTVTSNNGIGYGGVDEDGEKDPSARRRRDVWDDEEEEEEW